jgi:hypothetical protein
MSRHRPIKPSPAATSTHFDITEMVFAAYLEQLSTLRNFNPVNASALGQVNQRVAEARDACRRLFFAQHGAR